jgi:uncharacterized protein (DUF2147 family)
MGLQVVSGMSPAGPGRWKGYIYNADDGGTYRSEMRFSGNAMVLARVLGTLLQKEPFPFGSVSAIMSHTAGHSIQWW